MGEMNHETTADAREGKDSMDIIFVSLQLAVLQDMQAMREQPSHTETVSGWMRFHQAVTAWAGVEAVRG